MTTTVSIRNDGGLPVDVVGFIKETGEEGDKITLNEGESTVLHVHGGLDLVICEGTCQEPQADN